MSIRMRLREERAQATVEMAVVTPVLLVLALIVYNGAPTTLSHERAVTVDPWRPGVVM